MDDNRVDDIVAMLDKLMSKEGGHVDIKVNTEDATGEKTVSTNNSLACQPGMACSVPTMHVGIDDGPEE